MTISTSPNYYKNLASKNTENSKVKHVLPLRTELRETTERHTEKYVTQRANTQRLKNSAIPYLKELLNKHDKEERKWTNMEE